MARLVLLDASPLWLCCLPLDKPKAAACRTWLQNLSAAGFIVCVPEIADYEVRREFLRKKMTIALARLDAVKSNNNYLPITTDAMLRAAEFWALLRNAGTPTAGPAELDGDAILAAQAALTARPGDSVTVATSNVGHLNRFPGVDAREWSAVS